MKNKEETDILQEYRNVDADGRLNIMLSNYHIFPKLVRKLENMTHYKIKCEKEYLRSRVRNELGVRVQTSKISNPTQDEAEINTMIEEAFKTGKIDGSILKGISNAGKYEADILTIRIMKMPGHFMKNMIMTDEPLHLR